MQAYVEKLNGVLGRYGVTPVAQKDMDDDTGRLQVLWEACVKLVAKLNGLSLDENTDFAVGSEYGGEKVGTARGGRINKRLYVCLDPDSVAVPINKSPTLAFLLIKRAAQALVDVEGYAQECGEEKARCDHFEETAAWEFTAFWDMAKAYRFKNNPTYKAWFVEEGES